MKKVPWKPHVFFSIHKVSELVEPADPVTGKSMIWLSKMSDVRFERLPSGND
jgi:hypothetical protein